MFDRYSHIGHILSEYASISLLYVPPPACFFVSFRLSFSVLSVFVCNSLVCNPVYDIKCIVEL